MFDPESRTSFVVGWGTLSFLNAGIARAMHRSGLGWWLLSLLLGPITTLLLAMLGPLPLEIRRRSDFD